MVPHWEISENFLELENLNGSKIPIENKKLQNLPVRYHMVFTAPWR
jgi:hypothetical protein